MPLPIDIAGETPQPSPPGSRSRHATHTAPTPFPTAQSLKTPARTASPHLPLIAQTAHLPQPAKRPPLVHVAKIALAALLLTLPVLRAHAAKGQKANEYDVKAAYLVNFGNYLRQPETRPGKARKTFDLCILGRDEFRGALQRVIAEQGDTALPERAVRVTSAAAARTCAVVFLDRSELDRVDQVMAVLAGAPVLTVSDMPGFLEHGGMIQLEVVSSHVRFAVSLNPVNRAGLGLSSQLLKVALYVLGTARPEPL